MFGIVREVHEWLERHARLEAWLEQLRRILLACWEHRGQTAPERRVTRIVSPPRRLHARHNRRAHGARSSEGHRPSAPRDGIPLAA